MVPVIIGANDRDIGFGTANSKDELAIFGPNAAKAAKIYDPNGDQSLDELKQQVFSDKWMTEPARIWLMRWHAPGSRRGCIAFPMSPKPTAAN